MANHAFVKLPKPMKNAGLLKMLKTINDKRFGGKLSIEKYSNGMTIEELPVWMASPKKVEIRHQLGGDVGWWIDIVVINDIALMTGGEISDEGVKEKKWKGVEGKYPSVWAWKASFIMTLGGAGKSLRRLFQEMLVREIQQQYPHLEELLMEGIEGWRSGELFEKGGKR